ncbi:46231_t:CDS:1, partial [Gigaspora margarita]
YSELTNKYISIREIQTFKINKEKEIEKNIDTILNSIDKLKLDNTEKEDMLLYNYLKKLKKHLMI